ncbi:MAG: hypothetical protein ABI689_09890 [Thermoanaerobaculia bacterium]
MDEGQQDDLARLLREGNESELDLLLTGRLDEIEPAEARQLFRNPFLTGVQIERVLASNRLLSAYEVRSEAARHPRTPQLIALRFIPGLYWADLVRLGLDMRLHPIVRRAAVSRLVERLPVLAVGEKIAIARSAAPGVLSALRHDPTPRVIAALLENPRLTEGLLLPLVAAESALPSVLAVIAGSAKWSVRYTVRLALCQNTRTPLDRVLILLPLLKRGDLCSVAANPHLRLPVRRRAQLLARGGQELRI